MKYPILGRERRRPIALSAVGTVLVLAFACVLFTLTVLAIQPGLLSDTLAAFWEEQIAATTPSSRRTVHCSGRLRMRWGIISWISTGVLWLQFCC